MLKRRRECDSVSTAPAQHIARKVPDAILNHNRSFLNWAHRESILLD